MSRWFEGLNQEQQEACAHNHGPMLILAGAGSGKTTTLVSRTGRLVEDNIAAPESICVLTFTNKAARELKNRVGAKIKKANIWTGTFHSFGLRTLKKYYKEMELPKYFGILDQQDSAGLIREILKDMKIAGKDKFDASLLLSHISRWRELGQREAKSEQEYDIVTEWLLPKYQRKKELLGVVDFDDLILKVIELYNKNSNILKTDQEQFQQIMVDEFQDTNHAQMKLVQQLAQAHQNISVVGDDDQSIYGWRGAQIQNILNFPKKYRSCKVIRLIRNYRSTPEILNFANTVIAKNEKRYDKKLIPQNKQGVLGTIPEVISYALDTDEIEGVAQEVLRFKEKGSSFKDVAILYRSNSQGAMIEGALRSQNIPYKISGDKSFLERKEIKDIHSYLKSSFRINDVDFRRIFNTPARGLGETTIEKIIELSKKQQTSFYKSAALWRESGTAPRVGDSIDNLFQILKNLKEQILNASENVGTILLKAMEDIGYRAMLMDISKDTLLAQKRWSYLEIYARMLDRFVEKNKRSSKTILDFIEMLDLKDDDEEIKTKDEVQLMTLHACKGLEFHNVILMGVEEDILPHRRLGGDVSEERRLFYVGITRAQRELVMTYSQNRLIYGKMTKRLPSRFLEEVDPALYKKYQNGRPISQEERKKMFSDLMRELESP